MLSADDILARVIAASSGTGPMFLLRRGGLESIDPRLAGRSVRTLSGILWITHEGDPGDHVLRRGDSYRIPASGRVVLQAFRTALVEIV